MGSLQKEVVRLEEEKTGLEGLLSGLKREKTYDQLNVRDLREQLENEQHFAVPTCPLQSSYF